MKREQVLFLVLGLVFGTGLGLVLGLAVGRPDLFGAAPPPAPAMAGSAGSDNPHASGGMGDVVARLKELERHVADHPDDAAAMVEIASIYAQANFFDRAISWIDRAVDAAGDDPRVLIQGAMIHQHAGSRERALDLARRAFERATADPEIDEAVASIALHGAGDLDLAARAIGALERDAPDRPSLPEMKQELERLREVLARAKQHPDDPQAQREAGNFYFDTSQWALAEACYRRYLEKKPGDPDVLTDLGVTLYRQGKLDEALDRFEEALAADSSHWQAALNATIVSIDRGDADSARKWLERLKMLKPDQQSIPLLEQQLAHLGAKG